MKNYTKPLNEKREAFIFYRIYILNYLYWEKMRKNLHFYSRHFELAYIEV